MSSGGMEPYTIIGVVGAGACGPETAAVAARVGALIAGRGAAVVCGGLGGVMAAAAQGAAQAGGLVIGVLPGESRGAANPSVHIPIVTGLGHARNVVIVHTAQALVAVEGEYGTLSEISIALKLGKPVAALGRWSGLPGVLAAATPEEAVERVFEKLR